MAGKPSYRCTRPGCGRDEIDARANGCKRGPCPMDLVAKRPRWGVWVTLLIVGVLIGIGIAARL